MAISTFIAVKPAQLWPQGDIRDPLGIWGSRQLLTGDATGGSIKSVAQAEEPQSAAYLYTTYSVSVVRLTGTITGPGIKVRILSNWPDIDPLVGIQGYASAEVFALSGDNDFTAPISVQVAGSTFPSNPNTRFILQFDPRPARNDALPLVEIEIGVNVDGDTFSFETYGYYWDRSVMNAPGGPRHPGAS